MSTEICKLCNKDSTPWIHINGHICQDCYKNTKRLWNNSKLSWINIKEKLPEKEKEVLLLLDYHMLEEEGFDKWKENEYKLIVQGYISLNDNCDFIAFCKSPHISFKAEGYAPPVFQINITSQSFPIPIGWVSHWMEISLP